MAEYKETFKIKSTEDLFAALEDHTVTLSNIKASKFFAVFDKEVLYWEKALADISETIEAILQVLDISNTCPRCHNASIIGTKELDVPGEYLCWV